MIMPKGNGRIPKAKSVQPAATKLKRYFMKLFYEIISLNYNKNFISMTSIIVINILFNF